MPHPLFQVLSDALLRRLAGLSAYERGQDYYKHGHVESVRQNKTGIRAVVRGQRSYEVSISTSRGRLEHDCDCPMGQDGEFCKHCVAASLAFFLNEIGVQPSGQLTIGAAAEAFAREPQPKLAEKLIEWARDDKLLRERLIQYASRRGDPGAAVDAARAAFRKAAIPRRYIRYGEAEDYLYEVDAAIDAFEELIPAGQAPAVVDLCEWAIRTLWEAQEMVHDDGEIGDLSDRLLALHLDACTHAAFDPLALARRLFRLEMDPELGRFRAVAITYADLLGPAGLVELRALASVPGLANHPEIQGILASIARASGDTDGLIAYLSNDLQAPHGYRRIIEVLQEAGRHNDVLPWALKGVAAFPKDSGLRKIAATEHHRFGEHAKAMELIWPIYVAAPGLNSYRVLEEHARRSDDWPDYRDNAIGVLRRAIAASRVATDHSMLVEIFLYEKNPEQAWREAHEHGCDSRLWLELAQTREKSHPGDAIPIYLRQAEVEISRAANGDYHNPVELLIRAGKLMRKIGAGDEFTRLVAALRLKYKAKRNFGKLLDERRARFKGW